MESAAGLSGDADGFTQAIDAVRAIKAQYVDDSLEWYKRHKQLPRVLYRLVGIATVILSVTLPARTPPNLRRIS